MGGLCEEGHEFLRDCRKRNPEKTKQLIDVLVTQHSRWVASRRRRSLFGQATSTAVETCDHEQQQLPSQCARTAGLRAQPNKNSFPNTAGSMRRLKAAFSNSVETPKVGSQIGQDGEIFPSSPSQTGVFIFRFSFFFSRFSDFIRASRVKKNVPVGLRFNRHGATCLRERAGHAMCEVKN
jgi:hypothetical protein